MAEKAVGGEPGTPILGEGPGPFPTSSGGHEAGDGEEVRCRSGGILGGDGNMLTGMGRQPPGP